MHEKSVRSFERRFGATSLTAAASAFRKSESQIVHNLFNLTRAIRFPLCGFREGAWCARRAHHRFLRTTHLSAQVQLGQSSPFVTVVSATEELQIGQLVAATFRDGLFESTFPPAPAGVVLPYCPYSIQMPQSSCGTGPGCNLCNYLTLIPDGIDRAGEAVAVDVSVLACVHLKAFYVRRQWAGASASSKQDRLLRHTGKDVHLT